MDKIIEFTDKVKKWSHVWTPMENCAPMEIRVINKIFTKKIEWDENRQCFILENLNIHRKVKRLSFLPPLIIEDTFSCYYNEIESLEGGPIEAKEYLCYKNKLKDLKGAPLKCKYFDCEGNPLEDFRIYTEPYDKYISPNGSKLIFLDVDMWTLEEFKKHEDTVKLIDHYV